MCRCDHRGSCTVLLESSHGLSSKLVVGDRSYEIYRLDTLQASYDVARLPYTLRILLENVLRNGERRGRRGGRTLGREGGAVERDLVLAVARAAAGPDRRAGGRRSGGDARRDGDTRRRPIADQPADPGGARDRPLGAGRRVRARTRAFARNVELEFERNHERYLFLRWGQEAFSGFKVVPPGTGICHQVNLEYLARVVEDRDGVAFPDTLVGTDSHTTMVNGLGVLGWGVRRHRGRGGDARPGALDARAAGRRLPARRASCPEGATATDLVLTVTEILRRTGVVGKFVEYFGDGVPVAAAGRPRDAREHVARVRRDLRILPRRPRDARLSPPDWTPRRADRAGGALLQGEPALARPERTSATYSQVVELDLGDVEPSLAGPRRPQDRVPLASAKRGVPRDARAASASTIGNGRTSAVADTFPASDPTTEQQPGRRALGTDDAPVATATAPGHNRIARGGHRLRARPRLGRDRRDHVLHEHVEPPGDGRAGLLARNAVERGLGAQAVGEVVARTWVEGRDALLRAGRAADLSRRARLQHGRLRLHDVHRQLRAAGRRDLGRDRRGRPRRLLGALRQPQLRGAHPPRGEGELPRLAPAGRRLRARRADGHRLRDGTAGGRRLPARHLAVGEGDLRHDRLVGARGAVRRDVRRRLHRRRGLAVAAGSARRAVRMGAVIDVRATAAVLRGDGARAEHRSPTSTAPAASCGSATR